MPHTNVLPKTTYTLNSSEIAAGKFVDLFVGLSIPCADAREACVILRVHDWTGVVTPTGAKVEVSTYNSAPSREDPSKIFRSISELGTKITFTYSANAPLLGLNTITSGLGEALDLKLVLFQATPTATNITITVSIDLVLKMG